MLINRANLCYSLCLPIVPPHCSLPDRADEEAITGSGQQKLDELAQNMQEQQQRKSTAQEEEVVNPRKEKSVLQTKLTKLAIQIGYGGELAVRSLNLELRTIHFEIFPLTHSSSPPLSS